MELSDAWSEPNQQVHIQTKNEKARQNGQRHSQSQLNKLTYFLETRNGQMHGQSQINKFAYEL